MLNKIKSTAQTLKSKTVKLTLVAGTALASSSAFANNSEAIEAAVASGQSMVSLTTSGVIALAALGFGLGMVVSWLRR
ncbi:hypothetical protein HAR83_002223 [Vibrio metschnikovii]|nr:hypothetical protein [Vibrio metschnikovii]